MNKIDPFELTYEPLAGATAGNLWRVLAQNGFHVSPLGYARVAYCFLLTSFFAPFNVMDRILYDRKIKKTQIKEPIFILGHWRSGTTFLHNLLSNDERYCYPTTHQTLLPASFITSAFISRPIVISSLPETRPQDSIQLGCDLPQEEEYALGNLSAFDFYLAWCFPRGRQRYYRYTLMDETQVTPREIQAFKAVYDYFLKKVVFADGGNHCPVMKNPSNTARVKILTELYPDARFINIHRDPQVVIHSTLRMLYHELPGHTLQTLPPGFDPERDVLEMYQKMHEKYFSEIRSIPKGRLVDIEYMELKHKPLQTMEYIYDQLKLGDFQKVSPILKSYIKGLGKVKTATYHIDEATKKRYRPYLTYAAEKWGYDV